MIEYDYATGHSDQELYQREGKITRMEVETDTGNEQVLGIRARYHVITIYDNCHNSVQ